MARGAFLTDRFYVMAESAEAELAVALGCQINHLKWCSIYRKWAYVHGDNTLADLKILFKEQRFEAQIVMYDFWGKIVASFPSGFTLLSRKFECYMMYFPSA